MLDDPPLTDADLYPTLSESGAQMLERLREHPHAPVYRNRTGNRLSAADVAAVRTFEREMLAAPIAPPRDWLPPFIARCLAKVPFYRRYGPPPPRLADLPTTSRADLSADVAQFVPDDLPLDHLIYYSTSGTSGHPLRVPSLPSVAAKYLAFHKRALRRSGVELTAGRGQMGLIVLGWQRRCYTYASVTPTMDEAGLAKINLHPDDWRQPEDRAAFLNDLNPEVFAGDPISFAALLELPLTCRPRALLSTAMALSSGLRGRLEERFSCPVADLYSMNETGPVAVYDPGAGGHVLLQPRLYVEILDAAGESVAHGTRGEITLTGGFNDALPLLRYRTGDQAALVRTAAGELVLTGLEGRPPVRYRTRAGEWINNLEVTHALQGLLLPQYEFHQDAGGGLRMVYCGPGHDADEIGNRLRQLFGSDQPLVVEHAALFEDKVVQYTSALPGAEA